jgi:uncharacterized membrane protein YfcA
MSALSLPEWFQLIGLIVALGGIAGFMAGLLGVGGGMILVPGLYYLFSFLGYDHPNLMHLAVGTSLAIIIPTGLSSARAHWRRGGVRMDIVKQLGTGIVVGVGVGAVIADMLSGHGLKMIFAIALFVFAGLMQIQPEKLKLRSHLPAQPWPSLAGVVVGILSTLMGIGGATLNVPYLTLNGVPIHTAIGSSSAMGLLIALPGAIGFMIIGWHQQGLPPLSIGYVSVLALAVIAPVSVLAAPLGARAAHAIPVKMMKRVFSLFVVIIAAKMLYDLIHG